MELRAVGNRVVIEQFEKQFTKGGIVLPDSAQKQLTQGYVRDIGHDVGISIHEGDLVAYEKYGGSTVELDGKKFMVVTERDILCVIENEDTPA